MNETTNFFWKITKIINSTEIRKNVGKYFGFSRCEEGKTPSFLYEKSKIYAWIENEIQISPIR